MQASQTTQLTSMGRVPFWHQIRWRLITPFVLLAVVPMIVVVSIIVNNSIDQIRQQTLNQLEAIAELKKDQLERWIRDSHANLEQFPIGLHRDMITNAFESFAGGEFSETEQGSLEELFAQSVAVSTFFDELFIYTPEGAIVASSNPVQTGKLVTNQPYFVSDQAGAGDSSFQTPYYDLSIGSLTMVLTHPLLDGQTGEPVGVLAGRLDLATLGDIMLERTGLGATGETYLVSAESNYFLTPSRFESDGYYQERAYHSLGIDEALAGSDGSGLYDDYREPGVPVLGAYRWLPDVQMALLAEINAEEAFSPAATIRNFGILITAVAAVSAAIIGYIVTQRISKPILSLTDVAIQIAGGDLSRQVDIKDKSEIGLLARTFNSMTEQIRGLIGGLEQRVAERTYALVVSAEVGNNISQKINNLDELLAYAVDHITARFNMYHTQIYLVDRTENFLDLRVGAGSAGKELVKRGHRLPIGSGSINGAAAAEKRTILVKDTQINPLHKPNPLLPKTRLELCVPLLAGDKLVGVLNMQSDTPYSLSEDDVPALEIMAAQLAIAVENARLLQESQEIKAQLEAQIQQNVTRAWDEYLDAVHQGEMVAYRYESGKVVPIQTSISEGTDHHVRLPVTVVGKPVGTIALEDVKPDQWSEAEQEIIQTIAAQIGQQIENLRLLEEAKRYRREAEEATSRLVREGWQTFQAEHTDLGFMYDQNRVIPLSETTAVAEGGLQSPLLVQGETIGALEIADLPATDTQTADFLTAVAARLSAHIENLRLNEQTEKALAEARLRTQELNTLNELAATLTAARETDEILNSVNHYSKQLIPGAGNLYVALYDESRQEIAIYVYYVPGEDDKPTEKVHSVLRRQHGNGITEYILRTRKPLLVNGDMNALAAKLGFEVVGAKSKSWLGVPMLLGEQAIGVIAIQSFTTPHLYDEHHMDLLTAVANSTAIALESLRLLQQVQGRARQEQILREVSARVYAAVDTEAILRTAAQEINRHLGMETFVYLEEHLEPETATPNEGNGHS